MKPHPKNTALLEIGVEELPARFVDPALIQLDQLTQTQLKEHNIHFSEIKTRGTPRRLTVFIAGLSPKTSDREDIQIGPPPKAAKDADGNWTQAAKGFAKAQKTSVSNLILQNTSKGERYVVLRQVKGQSTAQALKSIFPELIKKLSFPKNMVWEASQFKFARPIRWMVALYNSTVIRFPLAGIKSDKTSVGLLSLGGQKIPIRNPQRYHDLLRSRCILVDPAERRKKILDQLDAITKRMKPVAQVVRTEDHLNEVVFLTEYPIALKAEFDEEFLKLPPEILINVLRKHQKFFPIRTQNGQLSHVFIGIRNGPSDHQDVVREGYERVTRARLADAQFFYDQDAKTDLHTRAEKLSGVGFIEGFGTLADKTDRVIHLTQKLGEHIRLNDSQMELAKEGAALAKADLLTQIVSELPELQGIAGRLYSHLKGQKELGDTIEQHYWPLTADGELPQKLEGAVVSVADKIDNLAANFAAGQIPTGSQDPFGLRRASIGIIRMIIEYKWNIRLGVLVEWAFELLPAPHRDNTEAKGALKKFFHQRIANHLGTKGFRGDEVEAVLANQCCQNLASVCDRLQGLKTVRGRPEFDSLSVAIKRARNILKQAEQKGFNVSGSNGLDNENLGKHETKLNNALNAVQPQIADALLNQNFEAAFLALAPLKEPVDAFFDGVMVMVDDETLRSQRLALLKKVQDIFDQVADFSKLQPTGS
jgi:glycyl-tRNA synthetase beta chain